MNKIFLRDLFYSNRARSTVRVDRRSHRLYHFNGNIHIQPASSFSYLTLRLTFTLLSTYDTLLTPTLPLNDDVIQLSRHNKYRSVICKIYIGRNWLIFLDSLKLDAGFLPTNNYILI